MTIQEAIEWQKAFKRTYKSTPSDVDDACDMAISALEKQISKKPRENKIRGGLFGKIKHYTCPTCGNCLLTKMMNERQNTSYCWDCGQEIDWRDAN